MKNLVPYYKAMKNTERLAGRFKLQGYNLLEHSFVVLGMFMQFAKIEKIAYSVETVDLVMHHDIVETVTGDLNYTVKNKTGGTKLAWQLIEDESLLDHPMLAEYSDSNMAAVLNDKQLNLLKAVDLLDLWVFCRSELVYGGSNAQLFEVMSNCRKLIFGLKIPSVIDFMENQLDFEEI